MSAVERAAQVIDTEYGPCNDDVNHDGRQAMWAAVALADAGLLVTDEIQAVLDHAAYWASTPELDPAASDVLNRAVTFYLASRPS